MDKLWPTLLIVVVLALVFVGMWRGWRRRAGRDSALTVPNTLVASGGQLLITQVLHVATTHHDRPLDRVVVPGLAFRANAVVTVSEGGVTITAPGEASVAIAAPTVIGIGAATWTIDRTVERDGLVLLVWRAARAGMEDPILDTYLRVTDPDQRRRLVASIRTIIPADPNGATVPTDDITGSEA